MRPTIIFTRKISRSQSCLDNYLCLSDNISYSIYKKIQTVQVSRERKLHFISVDFPLQKWIVLHLIPNHFSNLKLCIVRSIDCYCEQVENICFPLRTGLTMTIEKWSRETSETFHPDTLTLDCMKWWQR